RTTIVIAHRLSSIKNANQIYVMDKGMIIEHGDHNTLMSKQGLYYDLMQTQNIQNVTEDTKMRRRLSSVFASVENIDDKENVRSQRRNHSPFITLLKLNSSEWYYILFGCLASICNGSIQTVFAIMLSKIIDIFRECDKQIQKYHMEFYCRIFFIMGTIAAITKLLQNLFFSCFGAELTKRLRSKTFACMLCQEVGWFDRPENATGALCTRLSADTVAVQTVTGMRIGMILEALAGLGIGLILGFIYCWQLALVIIGFLLLLFIISYSDIYSTNVLNDKKKYLLEQVGMLTIESIQNIHTVKQLTKEDDFVKKYSSLLHQLTRLSKIYQHKAALIFGITMSMCFFILATLFTVAAHLIKQNAIKTENIVM
ncbi:unnamed protein product, partial [Didymodactylos carnosus]